MPQLRERRKAPDGTLIEWDGRGWLPVVVSQPAAGRGTQFQQPRMDAAIDALPAIGGAVGGMVGGAGGTVAGAGVGGVPGAIGGAALGGAAGESARQLINRATGRRAPASAGEAASGIATQAAIQGGSQAVGGAITGTMAKSAPWLMNKAVRPSARLLEEYRMSSSELANTLLEDGINVTQGGLDKLRGLIFGDNAEIQALVNASPARISKDAALGRVDTYAGEAMRSHVNPNKALTKATQVADEFVEHPYYRGDTVSAAEAQRLKVGTYQEIGDAFNKPQRARALKALARGLKEEVADAVPGVAAINAREARRLGAGEAVATRIGADNASDPLGLLFAASNPQLFIAGLINRQPVIKSMLARGMYATASRASGVPENVLRGAVYAVAEGQEDER